MVSTLDPMMVKYDKKSFGDTKLKQISKFCCSNPKFDHFYKVHHLLVEVHLVPLLPVHLNLHGGDPWWNMVILGLMKNIAKFEHSRSIFRHLILSANTVQYFLHFSAFFLHFKFRFFGKNTYFSTLLF